MTFVTAKALAKEAALASPAHRTRSAQAFASFNTPKPLEFLDIIATRHPQASPRKDIDGEDNGKELNNKDDSKPAEDIDLDEVNGFLNDDVQVEAEDREEVLSPKEQALVEEWTSWHKALEMLKHSIANKARVLNSIKELIPLGEAFSFWVNFRGVKVRSWLAKALSRFFEHASDADVRLLGLSLFMHGMIFEELRTLLYGIKHTSVLEIIQHRLLCWLDMISDVAALGVPMGSLVKKLGELCDTMFGLRLEKGKNALDQFIKINKLMRVLELQRKELDADVSLIGLSHFMRRMIFEELGTLLYGLEHTSSLEITEQRLLCWQDMISDVAALSVPVASLVKKLGELRDTMLGLWLEKDKSVLDQFIKVNKLMHALGLQHKEQEVEKLKLNMLVRGNSKEIVACLQLAVDQLHVGTFSSYSKKWCFELNTSPFCDCTLCMTICIFLTLAFFCLV
ncbi:hypothetical protein C1H46_039128 [Malus baccata]|uniref:Uncharacterized protein n=1 Tax=Malus baccata TaxID=106549 RepID=A0A540KM84_MALBA|nr:hypothetical protein C1H46_039128 [Malus baccata]